MGAQKILSKAEKGERSVDRMREHSPSLQMKSAKTSKEKSISISDSKYLHRIRIELEHIRHDFTRGTSPYREDEVGSLAR